jgi:hypothetical protein
MANITGRKLKNGWIKTIRLKNLGISQKRKIFSQDMIFQQDDLLCGSPINFPRMAKKPPSREPMETHS